MKSGSQISIVAMILFGEAMPLWLAVQDTAKQGRPHQYHPYQIGIRRDGFLGACTSAPSLPRYHPVERRYR